MPYSLKNTRNTEVETVADNILKTTSFGIRVPGKNFAGYGEAVGQTLLHILENFASPNNGSNLPNPTNSAVSLTSPAVGQLWYDTTNLKLRVWNGTVWAITSGAAVKGPAPPSNPLEGDLWWNSTTKQLFAYDGANWLLVAPMSSSTDLVFVRAIKINSGGTGGAGSGDGAAPSGGTNTDAMGMFVNNVLEGIWSGVQVAAPTFYFIELNDDSGNVRYYSISPFGALIEDGLNIGAAATIYFNGRAKVADTADGVSGINAVNLMRNDDGAGATTSRLPTTAALDMGNSTTRWGTIFGTTFDGTATAALYADLAERYETDMAVEVGDVMKIGGDKEITKTTAEADVDVFGVVSETPGFRLNDKAGDDKTHPFIALAGRLNVKVKGTVKKGQRLVSSNVPGVAIAKNVWNLKNSYCVIGRALEDKTTDDIGLVEVVVGAK